MATDSALIASSTTQAAAAQVQSREGASVPQVSPPAHPKLPVGHFTIGLGVTRIGHARPYQRKPCDPLYRPLRIFTRDPAANLLQGSVSSINIPYEPLRPGPEGKLLEVDSGPGRSTLDLEDPSILISGGLAPSVAGRHSELQHLPHRLSRQPELPGYRTLAPALDTNRPPYSTVDLHLEHPSGVP